MPFLFLGIFLMISVSSYAVILRLMERAESSVSEKEAEAMKAEPELPSSFSVFESRRGVVCFYVISVIVGVSLSSLYFVINNNADVYLNEVAGFSRDAAKAIMIVAALSSSLGPIFIVRSCERHKDFFAVCLLYTLPAMLFFTVLLFTFREYYVISFALLLLFMLFINGARSVTLSIAAVKMRNKIDTGRYSVMVNSISSLSMGITPALAAGMIEKGPTFSKGFAVAFGGVWIWGMAVTLMLTVLLAFLSGKKRKQKNI